ncbi:hypothetical protein LIER_33280 [Lithospermum erythrorhizon]|uniref:Bifunctional inhibitor/plant lipid transfer protein/seed storage helical domain-containing protein n=1 Tax=Lithospermum erythrorhizon TaxID=34254 RepID=A0AAV3RXM5_LITER
MVLKSRSILLPLLLHFLIIAHCLVAEDALDDSNPCGIFFTKFTACLRFATGKIRTPNKECCDSISDINNDEEKDMLCLCYLIQRIHHGNSTHLMIMGVQETVLLQLPSACNFEYANVADCPKLMELPPDSPDAAIFNNFTSSASPPSASPPLTYAWFEGV